VQHTFRQVIKTHILRPETKHVGRRDRFCGYANHVADYPADSSIRPTERLNSRWMIMGLYLKGYFKLLIKIDDTGIFFKRRPYPGSVDLFCSRTNGLIE
jgi:hypothetical protein